MRVPEFYTTLARSGTAEFKDRGSRFIAYAFPVSDTAAFKKVLEEIKKEHPKATHHCFAYRLGLDQHNYRVSDAGEPSGTAGRPILGQIDSKGLTNTLIVVVRYFGGTLLGVPGLIHAYKTAAALVLQSTPAQQLAVEDDYTIQFDYTQMNDVMLIIRQSNMRIIEKEIGLYCRITAGIPRNRKQEALQRFSDLQGLSIDAVPKPD